MTPTPSAGASAQREFERRVQRRDQAVRAAHPKLGGLLLALFNEPASTRVWAQGASGERAIAAKLAELGGEHVTALHDRSVVDALGRRTRANIDHIAILPHSPACVDTGRQAWPSWCGDPSISASLVRSCSRKDG